MIFSTKLTIKNIHLQEWFRNNISTINISLIFTVIFSYIYSLEYLGILTLFGAITLVLEILINLITSLKLKKIKGAYWSGQLAHLGIGIFAIGLILNVTQSYSNEFITNEEASINFGGNTYIVNRAYEVSKPEKNIINLPITKGKKNKNTSLNIFKNSSQQAISSPAIFRNLESDTYVTIKFIDNNYYKLIFRKNYGILIMWLGLAMTTTSVIPKVRKNEK